MLQERLEPSKRGGGNNTQARVKQEGRSMVDRLFSISFAGQESSEQATDGEVAIAKHPQSRVVISNGREQLSALLSSIGSQRRVSGNRESTGASVIQKAT